MERREKISAKISPRDGASPLSDPPVLIGFSAPQRPRATSKPLQTTPAEVEIAWGLLASVSSPVLLSSPPSLCPI
ncbi:hypothetical protein VTN96DRAFT_1755 [Rasamsonia emersonii]